MSKSAVCCVSTYNYLHQILVLARSIRRCWVEQPTLFVLLLDHQDQPRPGFEKLEDVQFLSPVELEVPDFNWLALKFSAGDLACACKPFVVGHALKSGHDVAWYVDSDILFMSDPSSMREQAAAHDLVVTPHILSLIPEREAWTRPTMGVLAGAGVLNAGLFTVRKGDGGLRFLEDWAAMTVGGGACLLDHGNNTDQHAFNWAPALAQDVAVCRDKRMNVAYWNLHERPIRWAYLDGGPKDQWLLDGESICCFHFSGFNWENRQLSVHDQRHHLGSNINLYHLAAHYDACLESAGREYYRARAYGYAKIGPLILSDGIRRHLKLMEKRERLRLDSWSDEGAALLVDRLLSVPGNSTLLPKLLEDFYLQHPALQALDPGEALFPKGFFNWCRQFLEPAWSDEVPLFLSSLVAVHRGVQAELVRRCATFLPDESKDWIADALVHQRPQLTAKLQGQKQADGLIGQIEAGHYLVVATNPAIALRLMMQTWPAAFASVPPLGKGNIQVFRERVCQVIAEHFIWPEAHRDFLDRLDPEVSLRRVMAVIRRHPEWLAELRRLGLSRDLISSLVPWLAGQIDFDATDLALIDWCLEDSTASDAAPAWRQDVYQKFFDVVHQTPTLYSFMHKTPERVRLASRLTTRFLHHDHPKAVSLKRVIRRIVEGDHGNGHVTSASRLLPLLADEKDEERWHGYLAWWARKNGLADGGRPLDDKALESLDRLLSAADWKGLGETFPSMAPAARGLNIFGYFKSPTGLGQQSRGIAAAQAANGDPHREIVLTHLTMADDFRLEDLYPDFAFHFPRNLAITYPHINYDLMDLFPARFFRGRETIGYIAWEQRDLHPEWCKRLDPYDRLFAVSRFAADSVARATGRDCQPLPSVVQVDVLRAKAFRRSDFDLPEDAFIAGLVFDASSSVERKNPLAAGRALVRAFRGRSDVMVVVKVANGDRPQFRRIIGDLGALFAQSGIRCRLITHVMPRAEVEGLMAQFDLYLSMHRSEGFGLTIAEAMWLGVPVVATGYSGNMDFMTEANSYPVRYRETVVRENEGPFQLGTVWAEPDVGHAAALCDHIYSDRKAARTKAAQAELDVRATVSVEAVAARLRELLPGSPPGTHKPQLTEESIVINAGAERKRVDVAVPCYRYGHFLRDCVESVLSQKDVEVRVLILDDASPDDTPAVAAELAAEDARVTFRRHAANRGHIATYNEGLDWAEADYLLLLSADDVLTPGALSRATRLMERHPEISVTLGDAIATSNPSAHKHDPPAQHQYQCRILSPAKWIENFCQSGINIAGQQTSTAVVRTSAQRKCGHYRAELPHAGDMEMWLRLAMYGPVGFVLETQAYYRQHGGAMHHDYPGILDIRQRKAAFDSFFQEHKHRLAEGDRLQHMANHRLATEATAQAELALSRLEQQVGIDYLRFARETEPQMFADWAKVWPCLAEASAAPVREG